VSRFVWIVDDADLEDVVVPVGDGDETETQRCVPQAIIDEAVAAGAAEVIVGVPANLVDLGVDPNHRGLLELEDAPPAPPAPDVEPEPDLLPVDIGAKARTILDEGADGDTGWTAGEQKLILARIALLVTTPPA
jgi:hypothetical protein